MRIEQSEVMENTRYEYRSEYELRTEASTRFRAALDGAAHSLATSVESEKAQQMRLRLMLDEIIKRMLEYITGHADTRAINVREALAETPHAADTSPGLAEAVPVLEWTRSQTERMTESERSDFRSTGTVRTADGRSIAFALDLSMCRSYTCETTTLSAGSVELRDPLVINFDGQAVELSGRRFAFDLDRTGAEETLPTLAPGSAYLAFDANSDGRINDGSELFGATSGDGFGELRRYDSDGNGWLDEADPMFSRMAVWQPDGDGKAALVSLREAEVGALYLAATETPFSLTDSENRLLGRIRASGVYLSEQGRAGSLQQVDLVV